ncbi:NUDIX hydrolase [Jannaschia ovalis]|uniref:NUDIX hydrolase n=1 Tax=Jannaschia ovalis TaxID=3038773 RepID=A0ABY8LED1_9RHOB|nr:NUDIX hydrolase [Jannaschia sp. GRR-S6-38]WGH79674.1 NUDIX hydrolase [Jannaschia sp. GRR-S6-38]
MPKEAQQIAALPMRWRGDKVEVLMVTSRDTGRWVVPKGWTMKGVKPWTAAAQEALEEAGAKGDIAREVFGVFHYDKVMDDGSTQRCRVRVYPMIVEDLKKSWKEEDARKRRWFAPREAAKRVDEAELADLLDMLGSKPTKAPVAGPLLKRAAS